MTRPSPATAPARPDLTFLRRRARPAPAPAPPPTAPPATAPPSPAPPSPAPPTSSLDLSPVTPAPAPVASASASLLDLSDPPAGPVTAPGRPAAPPKRGSGAPDRRVAAGRAVVLTPAAPVVSLTRIQSGVGVLTIEAACSEAVGDLRLGCAYRLRNGASSLVQHHTGHTSAPVGAARPILFGERRRFETVSIDLLGVREVDRLLCYAFSAAGGGLAWGGTLVFTTFGGSRVEVAMDGPISAGVVALATVFNLDGELVIRAEAHEVHPTVREACLAYGFDRITWLDPQTPAS